jgi:hypothetical protein
LYSYQEKKTQKKRDICGWPGPARPICPRENGETKFLAKGEAPNVKECKVGAFFTNALLAQALTQGAAVLKEKK